MYRPPKHDRDQRTTYEDFRLYQAAGRISNELDFTGNICGVRRIHRHKTARVGRTFYLYPEHAENDGRYGGTNEVFIFM
jgi:hypothetical protein